MVCLLVTGESETVLQVHHASIVSELWSYIISRRGWMYIIVLFSICRITAQNANNSMKLTLIKGGRGREEFFYFFFNSSQWLLGFHLFTFIPLFGDLVYGEEHCYLPAVCLMTSIGAPSQTVSRYFIQKQTHFEGALCTPNVSYLHI